MAPTPIVTHPNISAAAQTNLVDLRRENSPKRHGPRCERELLTFGTRLAENARHFGPILNVGNFSTLPANLLRVTRHPGSAMMCA